MVILKVAENRDRSPCLKQFRNENGHISASAVLLVYEFPSVLPPRISPVVVRSPIFVRLSSDYCAGDSRTCVCMSVTS